MRKLIEIEVKFSDRVVYKGSWDSVEELSKERLPFVFAEHIAKKLEVK